MIKNPAFVLAGHKGLINDNYDTILIDATETPIERPKKSKRSSILKKKKRHSLKSQIILDKKSRKIISTAFSNGRKHDFKLLNSLSITFIKIPKFL